MLFCSKHKSHPRTSNFSTKHKSSLVSKQNMAYFMVHIVHSLQFRWDRGANQIFGRRQIWTRGGNLWRGWRLSQNKLCICTHTHIYKIYRSESVARVYLRA